MNKQMVLSLLNKVIKVDRGGPESRVGRLVSVENDHFTLLTEDDGVVYYKMQHVKSITQNSKNRMPLNLDIPDQFDFKRGSDFKSVLSELRHEWVKVNRGGPEAVEGVLEEVTDDYVIIISKEEVIRIAMFHIKNVSYGIKLKKQNSSNDSNNQENQDSEDSQENESNQEGQNNQENQVDQEDQENQDNEESEESEEASEEE